ncbi:type II toxin-antitoxin system YafO family toxin [Vreelandella jeotgali]|uniref:type II toxin-antitoxin system YafO family toxin n=1 Tax=Vreelandella jeotgali TaxID=553386 RepID=UPI0035303B34
MRHLPLLQIRWKRTSPDQRRYCLIAMLYPEAHHKSRNDTPLMRRLAEMAESFQDS